MAFTTWSALKTLILDDISAGKVLTKAYNLEGQSRTFRDFDEVQGFLNFCDIQIAKEARPNRRRVNLSNFR